MGDFWQYPTRRGTAPDPNSVEVTVTAAAVPLELGDTMAQYLSIQLYNDSSQVICWAIGTADLTAAPATVNDNRLFPGLTTIKRPSLNHKFFSFFRVMGADIPLHIQAYVSGGAI